MAPWYIKIASPDCRTVPVDAIPSLYALLDTGLAVNGSFVTLEYPCLAGGLFSCRGSCLVRGQHVNARVGNSKSYMSITENVPFKTQINLLDDLATFVADVNIHKDAASTNPDLTV